MEIEKLLAEKQKLEEKLFNLIEIETAKFEANTGYQISNVYVNMVKQSYVGLKDAYMIRDIRVIVRISDEAEL